VALRLAQELQLAGVQPGAVATRAHVHLDVLDILLVQARPALRAAHVALFALRIALPAFQLGASNENAPIRVLSPGGSGSVEQSNDVTALAVALNLNETCQRLMQEQTGKGSDALQVGGQGSWDDQRGGAWSRAVQGGMPKHKKR